MFISQTRVRRTANLNTREAIPPVEVVRFDGIVHDIEEAVSYVPPGQKPDPEDWGGFDLFYDLRCSIAVNILGLLRGQTRHVLIFYDVWPSSVERIAGDPPALRESLHRGYSRRLSKAEILSDLREHVRRRIEDVSLRGLSGDLRDMRLVALADEQDDEGILADAREIELTRDIDTAVTNPSSAPLRTKQVR